ncbi:hypothetical protein [Kitasatospora sp. NPDC057198]|uniref:hypothetical protein n=1 Tax=Kitasatospora sp. NPDC057198 TaxID=3346046 RepID=UPI003638A6B5
MSIPVPPQQNAPHAPHPGAGGPYPAGPSCRFCGSTPAVNVTVRGHQGFLVMMRFLSLPGPFCRSCGEAAVRRMNLNSLWQGWWGLASLVINPVTMLVNLATLSRIRKLPAPVPPAPVAPAPTMPYESAPTVPYGSAPAGPPR